MAATRIFPRLGFAFVSCAYLTLSASLCNSLHFLYSFTPLYTFDIPLRFLWMCPWAISPMPIYHLNFNIFGQIQTKKHSHWQIKKLICQVICGKEISPFINFRMYKNKKTPIVFSYWCQFLKVGRDTGVEPVHARFTAECVHRFTNRATRI